MAIGTTTPSALERMHKKWQASIGVTKGSKRTQSDYARDFGSLLQWSAGEVCGVYFLKWKVPNKIAPPSPDRIGKKEVLLSNIITTAGSNSDRDGSGGSARKCQ